MKLDAEKMGKIVTIVNIKYGNIDYIKNCILTYLGVAQSV